MATATLTRTDEQVQTDVLAELKWNAQVQPNEIGVAVKNGVVTLTGWVDSYLKKWSAEEAAHRVNGVKAVASDIEVRLPNSSERTDADIALAAVRALEWDAGVPSDKVKATVSKGWVTLRGEVEWQYQKLDAEQVIRRLMGIKGVTNLVTVKPCLTHDERNVAIVRASYEAYVSKNRSALEPLIADDFHFTSPLDNRIDRVTYFTHCWPNSEQIEGFEFIHLLPHGDRVFVTYEGGAVGGRRFRNTEILTLRGGQIIEAEVYFGWSIPHEAKPGDFIQKG